MIVMNTEVTSVGW